MSSVVYNKYQMKCKATVVLLLYVKSKKKGCASHIWSKRKGILSTFSICLWFVHFTIIWLRQMLAECYKIVPIRVRLKMQQVLPSKEGVTFIYGCESELWLSDLYGLCFKARIRSFLIRATCHYHPAIQNDSHFQATN